jgi:hypothetical protein
MQFTNTYKLLIAGIIVGATIVYAVSSYTTERKLTQLQSSLENSIDSSVTEATELALLIGRGGFTPAAESIIADCTSDERNQFEDRLSRLDEGLSIADLAVVDKLFSRCAPVTSVRRTLMVMDLSRQVEGVALLVEQRKQLGSYTKYDGAVSDLSLLVELEDAISGLSFDLVYLQREIIDSLIAGESVSSPAATSLRERGFDFRTELNEKAEAAQTLRTGLTRS